jgi:uracil-DNA glycosylase
MIRLMTSGKPPGHTIKRIGAIVMEKNLKQLYQNICDCHVCPHMNTEKALRRTDAVDTRTDVMIISEALAPEQLRRSGVNFFQADGKLGSTGRMLDLFLNLFGRTVDPSKDIRLSNSATIPACASQLIPVYNSEMAQCFPGWEVTEKHGKKGKKIRPPRPDEVQRCIAKGFLKAEIEQIQPKLILLMGRTSYKFFFKEFLGLNPDVDFISYIKQICDGGAIPHYASGARQIPVMPIVHFSPRARGYWKILNKQRMVDLILAHLQ